MPALSVKKCSQRGENHFWRAFLACRLGLELFARPHNETVIRISSKTDTRDYLIRIPAISVTKQNPNKFSLVLVAETVRLLEAYVSIFVIPAPHRVRDKLQRESSFFVLDPCFCRGDIAGFYFLQQILFNLDDRVKSAEGI